ncbi:MAG: M36 family metallopeptidase [Ruegeria sp.]
MLLLRTPTKILAVTLASFAFQHASAQESNFHTDGRTTPRLDVITSDLIDSNAVTLPAAMTGAEALVGADESAAVLQFLAANSDRYGLSDTAAELQLTRKQQSRLGKHYVFRQFLGGLEVVTGEIVVSVGNDGVVTRVSNNIHPVVDEAVAEKTSDPAIAEDAAYDAAWQDLGVVDGAAVLEQPTISLKYLPSDGGFRLVYEANIAVSEPYGYWQYLIDAGTGEVIQARNRATDLGDAHKRAATETTADRLELFRDYEMRALQQRLSVMEAAPVAASAAVSNGKAQVFDPDPITTLQDSSLTDTSDASAFDGAYQERELMELTERDGAFHLEGPWVQVVDWDRPFVDPTTTPDGIWTALRGDLGFNDAMTYYHIDQTQRYLRSLGYTDIVARPIEVDANGVNGGDNSYHVPDLTTGRSGRLAFGHGCVDDNEDADVIWHEYGHAIHADIVGSNWTSGDTGAMGEGFGDYLAASLSLRATGGANFQLDRVFNWDGGTCWAGRSVNMTGAVYDPGRTYPDHVGIGGGAVSDELWGSPLFQAQLALVAAGKPMDDADAIIIEGMFGISSAGARMPDLAMLTVLAAEALFPGDIHAGVFLESFQRYNICDPNQSGACVAPTSVTGAAGGAETPVSKN